MSTPQARFTPEEFARRGEDIYQQTVQPSLRPEDEGKFVAIDIETADFEIDSDDYSATERLLNRHKDAQIWLMQVGQRASYRLGVRSACGAAKSARELRLT